VRYVQAVHRLGLGVSFIAFDPGQAVEAEAHLTRGDGDAHVLHVSELRPAPKRAARPLVLVQGFAKADKCDAIVRDATELGATAIVIAPMARSVARPPKEKHGAREARWRKIADEAARQSGRGDAPNVVLAESLEAALAAVPAEAAKFLLWERATDPLGPQLGSALATASALAFVVGPEGGLEEREVELCRSHGFLAASLGPFVLRTETVAAAVLGAVQISGASQPPHSSLRSS
jgi:16S rRNA (uracil1498-N3)-methyltransferase